MRDVDQGRIKATSAIGKLKFLEDSDKKVEYLNVVKELSGYNSIAFPYCLSSVRQNGYVIPRYSNLQGRQSRGGREGGRPPPQFFVNFTFFP